MILALNSGNESADAAGASRAGSTYVSLRQILTIGENANCVGNCSDFAIPMSALVEFVADYSNILASNNTTDDHAYAQVYLGKDNAANSQTEEIIRCLKARVRDGQDNYQYRYGHKRCLAQP